MADELYRGRPLKRPQDGKKKRTAATPARRFAVETCCIVRERNAYAHEVLEKRLETTKLSKEDRAFAQVLVLGVAATWGTLDEIIDMCLNDPSDVKPDLRDALRISVYELFFLKKEVHAAVDQGVELAKYIAPYSGGLANAVLRKAVGLLDTFPFGEPTKDIEALARLFGFPVWLAARLIEDLGGQGALALMRASNEQAPLFIAVNAARATDDEIVKLFQECGVTLVPQDIAGHSVAGCYFVDTPKILMDGRIVHALSQGKIIVSDLAAQAVAQIALPDQKPGSYLEIGAGRGTKTILLQSNALRKYGSQMEHVTLDNHAYKARLLKERASKCGIAVKDAATFDATTLSESDFPEGFDCVFIDAPCSGLGTLRRHPEIRWRLTSKGVTGMAETGLAMLKAASKLVHPGGMLVFSTCTVTKEENEGTIMAFLKSEEGTAFKLKPIFGHGSFATSVDSGASDAHFAAVMVRQK